MITKIIAIIIILVSFAIGIYFYPQLPDNIVSHWDAHGQPNGHMSKFWGLFLLPIILVVMAILFFLIPEIDPLKENIEKFRKHYNNFILLIVLFLFYIYLLTVFWNMGIKFDFIRLLMPAFGIIFYFAGILINNAKRNYFIGIRTPWTLYSENVWDKTHEVGGKLFKSAGVIVFFGILFPQYAFVLMMVSIFFAAGYSVIYSYVEYNKEKKLKA